MLDATLYIIKARAQRAHANDQVRLVKKYYEENLCFNRSNYVITFDHAQNFQLSHFGEE